MRLSSALIVSAAFVFAAGAAILSARTAVHVIETRTADGIKTVYDREGFGWVDVSVDGLQVALKGSSPSEATRFRAITLAGTVVDGTRIIDAMTVIDAAHIEAPRFAIEILRNGDGISLIGLIPAKSNRTQILRQVTNVADGASVTDLLETADFPIPDGWDAALKFSLSALQDLPRSKISVAADEVSITAISDSAADKHAIEQNLSGSAPAKVFLIMEISAPRPVIAPFALRFLIDDNGARFDACSADTEESRALILGAAQANGLGQDAECRLGLGVPSVNWGVAVATAIDAMGELGGGTLTFSNADVSLVAAQGTDPKLFNQIMGELETDLPGVFSLKAILPEPPKEQGDNAEPVVTEFIATRSPEGQVQMRGHVADERARSVTDAYAFARFGTQNVYISTRMDDHMPTGWTLRVLAGLEALAELNNGVVTIKEHKLDIRGVTGNPDARANVARILASQLDVGQKFNIQVVYEEKLDPIAALPTPEECVNGINAILAEKKISFAPGSETLSPDSGPILDRIAALVKECQDVEMEIAGHTDSQGREKMNLNLSQGRSEAVLSALMARRILTSRITAQGYGETSPIADNDTEDGREANRRIEFTLVVTAPEPEPEPELPPEDTVDEDTVGEDTATGDATAENPTREDLAIEESADTEQADGASDPAPETEETTSPTPDPDTPSADDDPTAQEAEQNE